MLFCNLLLPYHMFFYQTCFFDWVLLLNVLCHRRRTKEAVKTPVTSLTVHSVIIIYVEITREKLEDCLQISLKILNNMDAHFLVQFVHSILYWTHFTICMNFCTKILNTWGYLLIMHQKQWRKKKNISFMIWWLWHHHLVEPLDSCLVTPYFQFCYP